ncbi:glutamate decarboxylase [Methanobacterium sp.]|uniref:glutamate decarboxylase n=1 Tax=Methanobacterium sp. TaxID=2164 RepID=UPI002ABCB3C1|nr:glutamate decarboxylase [Methanobacterium sp.]MDY9924343.1 glutamate decarboxylase [Methanobacterium sp.]
MLSYSLTDEEIEEFIRESEELSGDETLKALMAYYAKESPKYEIPEDPIATDVVYHMIRNELKLDGNPSLNLASFVTTEMDEHAEKLFMENAGKNFVDQDEYPYSSLIQDRVISILARLYNAPEDSKPIGTSVIGSSEAIMLGLLAHKWNWKKKRESEGKSTDKPNIIFGEDVHVVWKKFARYFDVEPRIIPMEEDNYVMNVDLVRKSIDENTICVGTVLGTTFTGEMDPISEINDMLIEINKEKGWNIPIHVDAASGGFVVPFIYPEMEWDFRLSHVRSINVSGHKYGLVFPGVGFLIFRNESDLPDDLIFEVNYLGGVMPTYSLNFSKGASTIIAQYFNLLAIGRNGYTAIMGLLFNNAEYLARKMDSSGKFKVINNETRILPLVAFELDEKCNFDVFNFSERIRQKGWIIPAYTLPKNAEDKAILRIVIRLTMSREQVNILYNDLLDAYDSLEKDIDEVLRYVKHQENIQASRDHHDTIC